MGQAGFLWVETQLGHVSGGDHVIRDTNIHAVQSPSFEKGEKVYTEEIGLDC